MKAGRCEESCRSTVLSQLSKVKDYRDVQQLCALACRYAQAGDAGAKRALYSSFERFVGVDNHGIERELMLVDGASGLRKVGDRIGRELLKGGDDWKLHVEGIWWNAKDLLGAGAARRALNDGSRYARVFLERALVIEASNVKVRRSRLARLKAEGPNRQTWGEFRSALENLGVRSVSPNVFARHATAEELRSAYAALATERRPLQLSKLLHVFARRRPPIWKPFLLTFARSSDDSVQRFIWEVLAHFRRPEVRRLALAAARRRRDVANGSLSLFEKNYSRGDLDLILAALSGVNRNESHGVGMSVLDIAKGNTDKALAPAYVAAYELTPCALCRTGLFKKLLSLKSAPEWMLEECLEDTDEDTRALARKAAR